MTSRSRLLEQWDVLVVVVAAVVVLIVCLFNVIQVSSPAQEIY